MLALALIFTAIAVGMIFAMIILKAAGSRATDYPESYDDDLHFLREAERRGW